MKNYYKTTINSTITELIPAICFNNRFIPKNYTEIESYFNEIDLESKSGRKTFVNEKDLNYAKNFQNIEFQIENKLKDEKLKNCFGILEYLYYLDDTREIEKCIWSPREKPYNIDKNHPGDIFVEFKNNDILGVSIKTGTDSSIEPRLNSRLKATLMKQCWADVVPNSIYEFKKELWDKVYVNIPNLSNSVNAGNYIHIDNNKRITKNKTLMFDLIKFLQNEPAHFDELYWSMLQVCNKKMIDYVNNYPKTTLKWIESEFRIKNKNSSKIETILLKAIGNKYTIFEDKLAKYLHNVKEVNAYTLDTSKQDWCINITSKKSIKNLE